MSRREAPFVLTEAGSRKPLCSWVSPLLADTVPEDWDMMINGDGLPHLIRTIVGVSTAVLALLVTAACDVLQRFRYLRRRRLGCYPPSPLQAPQS